MNRDTQSLASPIGVSDYAYDLFVVHAAADRAWVEGYLKVELGLEPGRAISPREFDPTATLPAQFERAVTSSRFTLLVLSPAFLSDEWARFGEQLVSFASVDTGQVRLMAVDRQACDLPLSLRFRVRLDFTDADPTAWEEEMIRLRAVLDRPAPAVEVVECPYPGMIPFRKQDARFFHGRDDEIQALLGLVRQNSFLLVIGPSGSGKSSLVTAGLLPRLDDAKLFGRGTWRVRSMRPGATPLDELARALGGSPDNPGAAVNALLDAEPPARRLLLVVDQFEELFSQVKDAAIREAFIGRLKSLKADPRCLVIVTVRADFYGDLMNSPLWPVDKSQIVDIAPLRGDAIRKAIVKPAEAAGVFLEERLVERLIADAANEPGPLPLLQEALVLLWWTMSGRLLTRASYDSLGRDGRSGLAVAMSIKADATLADLVPEKKRIARRIFLRLVQFGEGRPDTRRQLSLNDLRAATDPPDVFDEVLQLLITNRLLTPSADESRGLRVDIAHEMLILGWPASQEWVRARRDAEKTRRRLAVKAEEWVRLGRGDNGLLGLAELAEADLWLASPDAADLGIDPDIQALVRASRRAIELGERRKQMWTRVVVGVLTAVILVISAIAVWGEFNRRDAVAAKLKASENQQRAEKNADIASDNQKIAEKNADEARRNAEEAKRNADEAKANAAEVLMGAGASALANGHSFDAMHRFAGAINVLPNSSQAQVMMRQSLGFLTRMTPRLEAMVEHTNVINGATFNGDGTRFATASRDQTARIWRADTGALVTELKGHKHWVNSAAFSEDDSRIVTASWDKTARIWRADTGALVVELKGHTREVNSAVFSTDGTRVLTASSDNTARIWRADTGAPAAELKGHTREVTSAAFSPDGSRVITASFDKTARIWRADNGELIAELKGHTERVTSAAFSPDGRRVVTASMDNTARIWRADKGVLVAELKGHTAFLASAAFNKDGTHVVSASGDKTVRIWRADTGALVAELKGHTREVSSAVFSKDGHRVITASYDGTARIWRADTGDFIAELKGHTDQVTSAVFSLDGTRVLTASADYTARTWRADASVVIAELKGHKERVMSASFSVDDARALTLSRDQTVRIWRADTGELVTELKGHKDRINSAVFGENDTRVVTASYDGTARIARADTGALVAELKGHTGVVNSAAFSRDGTRVVTASSDKTARIWRADTGALVAELKGHTREVNSAVFSTDGTRVVTASNDDTARTWRADTGAPIAELKGHTSEVNSAAFSEDGSRVATASWDNTARIWRADTSAPVAQLKGHKHWVNSAAFSEDDKRVLTLSRDQTARVWNADTGALVTELKGHNGRVNSAVFSMDGTRVVTASNDGTARIWRADTGVLVAELNGHIGEVNSAAFSMDGTRVITASHDKTALIWNVEPVSGTPPVMPLWVDVLTGTELMGGAVRPLSLEEWNQRKDDLKAKGKDAPPATWFTRAIVKTPRN